MKLWSVILSPGQTESQVDASWGLYVQRLGTHDQMCLIFLFLASFSFLTKCNSSHLETLIRFCMEMFKYSEFDLERTTTNSTIIVYISLDFLLWQTLPFAAIEQNTASESFVLIVGRFLLQFTKLVIGLSKSIMEAAIKNTGHSGRRLVCGEFNQWGIVLRGTWTSLFSNMAEIDLVPSLNTVSYDKKSASVRQANVPRNFNPIWPPQKFCSSETKNRLVCGSLKNAVALAYHGCCRLLS